MASKFDEEREIVCDEVYQLLLSTYCYLWKLRALEDLAPHESRIWILVELIALRHMANEIILGICRLDEEGNSHSLQTLLKTLRKTKPTDSRIDAVRGLLKAFRGSIGPLKNKHRLGYIAHRREGYHPDLVEHESYSKVLKPAI